MSTLPRDWAALGARLNKWSPPATPFDPAGDWAATFVRHVLIPGRDGAPGGGAAGSLELRQTPASDGLRLDAVEIVVTGFSTLTTGAAIECGADPLCTPRSWTLRIRWQTNPPAQAEKGEIDQDRSGCVAGDGIVLRGARERRIPAPPRWTSFWSLFSVVPRLPFEKAPPLEFDLLEDLDLHKPGQCIVYIGVVPVEVGGTERNLHVFEQTGHGAMPWRWWLDDRHRILLAAGERRAYLAGPIVKGGAA